MKVKVLPGGFAPSRAHFADAGVDFRTPEAFTLRAGESRVVDLKVAVEIPIGWYGLMESKSGLMVKHQIVCEGGTIDAGFRGSIMARMTNRGKEPYHFFAGDKLVQMVIMPCLLDEIETVSSLDDPADGRGENGWGSTGR